MSSRVLAGLVAALALLAAAGVGWSLFHDDSDARPQAGRHGVGTGEAPSPSPVTLAPQKPVAPPTFSPAPRPSTAPVAPPPSRGDASGPAPAKADHKVTKATPGKGGGIVVVVQGPDGKPISGAIVDAGTTGRRLAPRPTNLLGEAALDPVAASEGKITGTVRHVRFPDAATFAADPGAGRVTVKLGAGAGGQGFIRGSIHDAKGGAPGHVDLEFYDDTGLVSVIPSESFDTWTGGGQFRVAVAPGNYTLAAIAPGYTESDKGYAVVSPEQDSAPVDLVIQAAGTISGRVTLPPDLQARRGPISLGFDLECVTGTVDNPNTTAKHVPQEIGDDGSFKLEGLQPGQYRVRATDGQRVSAWVSVTLAEGSQATVNLGLAENAASTVRGTVRDMLGNPVPGAHVSTKLASTHADSSGAFELRGIDPGRVEITVEMDGYVRRVQTIEVQSPGTVAICEVGVITLPRCGSATGQVTRGGKPVAGVSVLAVEKQAGGSITPHGPATTDASGAWRIDQLPPGSYYLKVGEGADAFDEGNAPHFTVRSGEVVGTSPVELPAGN